MAKIQNVMATSIKLDTVGAAESLKSFNTQIRAVTNAWKAAEIQQRSAGNSLAAAEAKYNGLGQTIDILKNKIELLKSRQSALDTSTSDGANSYNKYGSQIANAERRLASLTAQQSRAQSSLTYYKSGLGGLQRTYQTISDVSSTYVNRLKAEGRTQEANKAQLSSYRMQLGNLTNQYKLQTEELNRIATASGKSSEAYQRQKQRVDQAATSLAKTKSEISSLEGTMRSYNSGLTGLQNSYRSITTVSNSYVNRLKAEGRTQEANKAQMSTYAHQIKNLTAQYKIQAQELDRIVAASGKSSNAFKEQQVKVNQTAASIGKAKSQMNSLNEAMHKANPTIWDRLKQKITGVNAEGERTHKTFKEVFAGSFLGNTLSNALSNAGSALKGIVKTGMELNGTAGAINSRFKAMGLSSRDIKQLDNQMNRLKTTTRASAKDISDIQARMTNWSQIGRRGARQMTEAIAGIGDSSKLTGQQMSQMSAGLMRVGATGKVTLSSLNRVTKVAPSFYSTLAKGAGMSEDKLKSLLASGKVTTKQFQQWMAASSKTAAQSEKDFSRTQAGAKQAIQQEWNDLQKTMAKPLFDAKSSGLQSLHHLLASPEIKKGAEAIGDGISKAVGYLDKHSKTITRIASDLMLIVVDIAKDVWKDFAKILGDIGDALGLTSKNAKDSKDPLKTVKNVLDCLAKNKTAIKFIAGYLVTIATIKTFKPVTTGIGAIATSAYGAYRKVHALHAGFKDINAIDKFKGPEKAFAQLGNEASKAGKIIANLFSKDKGGGAAGKLGGALQSVHSAKGFSGLSTAGKVATGFSGAAVAVDATASIIKGFKDRKGSKKQFEDIGKGMGSGIGGGIGLFFGGPMGAAIGSAIGKKVGAWGGAAVKKFQDGWKKNKPPKNFWSIENLGWSTKDTFKKIGKAWDSYHKSQQKRQSQMQKEQAKQTKKEQAEAKKRQKAWNSYWSKVGKGWNSYWSKVGRNAQKGQKNLQKSSSNFQKKAKSAWSRHWKESSKTVGNWATQSKKSYEKGIKYLKKDFSSYTIGAKKSWKNHWNSLTKSVSNFWTKSQKAGAKGAKALQKSLKNHHRAEEKLYKKAYTAIRKTQDDFNKNMQKDHGNMLKALLDTSNDRLKDLHKAFSDGFDNIRNKASKTWDTMRKDSSSWGSKMNSWFSSFSKSWNKGWGNLSSAVSGIWSKAWDKMKSLAHSGMQGLVNIVNKGISAVNTVIGFFGGSKSTFKQVKLATGTGMLGGVRRAITKPTLAVVNDGSDSPETDNKEALYRPATGEFSIFQGRNTPALLMPGDEVLNATETKLAMRAAGFEHFAGGTGFLGDIGKFFGGIGNWIGGATDKLKKWFDTAENVIKNPGKYLDGIFHWDRISLDHGAFLQIAQGGFKAAKKQVSQFWKTLWNMVSGQLDGGGAEGGLLGAVEKYGKGHPYVWGAAGPDSFDCSGLVMYALKHAFGVSFPHYSGAQFSRTVAVSDPQPGDLVFYGRGGSQHVGVYAGGGKYFSAMSPAAGIGMSAVGSGAQYRRIPGLKGEGATSTGPKASKGLEAFVKKTVGSGFWKFISKLGDLFGIGAEVANPGGMGVARWEQSVVRALKKNGFAATPFQVSSWMKVIQRESNGNPGAVNNWDSNARAGWPTKGLVQTRQDTFDTNAFPGHTNVFNGYDDLLAGIHYAAKKYGRGSYMFSRVAAYGYANGGIISNPQVAALAEDGIPETVIPWDITKRGQAYQLINQTLKAFGSTDKNDSKSESTDNKTDQAILSTLEQILLVLDGLDNSNQPIVNRIEVKLGNSVVQRMTKIVQRKLRDNQIRGRLNISGLR